MRASAAALLLACAALAAPAAMAASDQDPCMPDPDSYGTGACVTCTTDLPNGYYDCITQACAAGVYTDHADYQHPDDLADYSYSGGYTEDGRRTCSGPLAQPYQDTIDAYNQAFDDAREALSDVREPICPIHVEGPGFGTWVNC